MENESESGEIEELSRGSHESSKPNNPNKASRTVKTKVPEVEIHLFRQGKGPIDVFKSTLGGWDQDLLEVSDILEKYNFKSIFAFNPESGRGVAIRFNPRNGRSLLPYKDGSVIFIDGEPKDSLVMPITKIVTAIAFTTFIIVMLYKDTPYWMKNIYNLIGGGTIPPWVLACAVIVFTRLRKRTRDLLKKKGW